MEKAGKKIKSTKTNIDVGECYRGCKKKTEVLVVVGVDSYFRQHDQGRPFQRWALKLRSDG